MVETQAGERRQEVRVAERQGLLADHEGVLCGRRRGQLRLPGVSAAQQLAENRLGVAGQCAFAVEGKRRIGKKHPVFAVSGKGQLAAAAVIERIQADLVASHGKLADEFQLAIVKRNPGKRFAQSGEHATFQPGDEVLGAPLARTPYADLRGSGQQHREKTVLDADFVLVGETTQAALQR